LSCRPARRTRALPLHSARARRRHLDARLVPPVANVGADARAHPDGEGGLGPPGAELLGALQPLARRGLRALPRILWTDALRGARPSRDGAWRRWPGVAVHRRAAVRGRPGLLSDCRRGPDEAALSR